MKAKIITDSMSDITLDVAQVHNIEVMPIGVSLGETYKAEYDLDVSSTMEWVDNLKKLPDFKGISTEAYVKVFGKYIDQGMEIICITAGSKSISNYDCACHASTRFPNANIHVIDSGKVSAMTGMMALQAALMANNGESANAIAIRLERTVDKYRHYGLADSLDFLKYAGKCPRFATVGVGTRNNKYEIVMHEDRNFDVQSIGNTMDKAINSYTSNIFRDLSPIDSKIVFMLHTSSDEDYFADVYRQVLALNYFDEVVVSSAGHYTSSLVGYNGIIVAYVLK